MKSPTAFLAALLVGLSAAGSAAADEKIWSYDSANDATRAYLDDGVTVVFNRSFFSFRVKRILATQADASARVEPVSERDLGVRLSAILPAGAGENALYAVLDEDEGPAMIRAFCPGSTRGWLVFSNLKLLEDATIHALGDDPQTGTARYCTTLDLRFRGTWDPPVRNPSRIAPGRITPIPGI